MRFLMELVAENGKPNKIGKAERDLLALGIATAAIILFVGTGGSVVPQAVNALLGMGNGPDKLLANALLLNIALIIFGWRRYRELTHEIAERRRAEEYARELAETDPLTGCLNRRSMAAATDELTNRAQTHGQAVAYAMIDIDNFKQVNDMFGHAAGDMVLTVLAERILKQLPKDALLARLGGDEFAFVASFDPAQRKRIDELVSRLLAQVATPIELEGKCIDVTMSVGIATDWLDDSAAASDADSGTLMHRADIAMYHAKKNGKNRYFWFEQNMERELRFRNEMEFALKRAMPKGEMVPFYEQQIDLDTGELTGFEMLARWRSPDLGLVTPETFIPIAEDLSLMALISEQLIEQALKDAKHWDETLSLAINIAPVQLRDPWFAQKLLKMLVEHKFPAQRLQVEVTQSCLDLNLDQVCNIIASLRNQGVRICLDEYGTGYSSLEKLRNIPFDRVKIGRAFLKDLDQSKDKSTVFEGIASLGRGFDLPLTVEGIEDEEMLGQLRELGGLTGQGFVFSPPESHEYVLARLYKMGKLTQHNEPNNVTTLQPASQRPKRPRRSVRG